MSRSGKRTEEAEQSGKKSSEMCRQEATIELEQQPM